MFDLQPPVRDQAGDVCPITNSMINELCISTPLTCVYLMCIYPERFAKIRGWEGGQKARTDVIML